MLDHVPLSKTLFIDIETVPGQHLTLSDLSEHEQELWYGKRGSETGRYRRR